MNFRQLLRMAWRWPLYSRTRAICTAIVLVGLVLVVPRLEHRPNPVEPSTASVNASSAGGTNGSIGGRTAGFRHPQRR